MPRPAAHAAPSQAAVLDAWADCIDDILDAQFDWVAATRWEPAPGDSPFAQEEELLARQYGPGGDWDGEDARSASALAAMMISLGGQHLDGAAALLRSRQVIAPLAPIIRSTFEAMCRVTWLLEPLVDQRTRKPLVRDRAARVMAVRLEDTTRAKTVAVSLGHPTAPRRGQQLRDLRRDVIPKRFYPSEIEDRDGLLVIRDQAVPGFRDSTKTYERVHGVDWKAPGAYDYLSNASHPTPSTIFEITAGQPDGSRRFEIESATYPVRLTRFGMVSFLHSWDLVAEYLNQPTPLMAGLLEQIDKLPEE